MVSSLATRSIDTMPRPTATSYRLGDDTLTLIDALAKAHPDPLGRPLSGADVIRLALIRLAESAGLSPQVVDKKRDKKSGK